MTSIEIAISEQRPLPEEHPEQPADQRIRIAIDEHEPAQASGPAAVAKDAFHCHEVDRRNSLSRIVCDTQLNVRELLHLGDAEIAIIISEALHHIAFRISCGERVHIPHIGSIERIYTDIPGAVQLIPEKRLYDGP